MEDFDDEDAQQCAEDEGVESDLFTTATPDEEARKMAASRRSKQEQSREERKRGHQLDELVGGITKLSAAFLQPPPRVQPSFVELQKELEALNTVSEQYPQMFPPDVKATKEKEIFAKYNVESSSSVSTGDRKKARA